MAVRIEIAQYRRDVLANVWKNTATEMTSFANEVRAASTCTTCRCHISLLRKI